MLILEPFTRTYGNPGEGPVGGEGGCPVQGGPGCATWGSGPVWGDGSKWCSKSGVPYEFVTEREATIHRLSFKIKYTYCHTPGLVEAFRIHEVRARIAPDRHADFPYHAFVDATTPTERIAPRIKYTAVEGVADTSGNAVHGSVVGSPSFHASSAIRNGYGMGFGPETSDGHVSIPYRAAFATAPFTVEFWGRLDDATVNEWSTALTTATSDQWDDGWGFYDRTSNATFTFWVNAYDALPGDPPARRYVRVARPEAGAYHHYVGIYDGETASLYIDGVLAGTDTNTNGQTPSAAPLLVGYGGFAQSGWPGTIDEVAFYPSALDEYSIIKHYEAQRQEYRAVVLANLPAGYWPLDEEGAYGNDLVLHNIQMTVQRKKHQPKG